MPTQENINEIASYLNSFEDGTRQHNQEDIHSCQSSHCLAGWKALEDAKAAGINIDDWRISGNLSFSWAESDRLGHFCEKAAGENADEIDYAAKVWGLNDDEEDMLFDGNLTLAEMKANLVKIAQSHGLTCKF